MIRELMEATNLNHLETDEEKIFTIEKVECIGACGGAPAVQVNYETIEGVKEGQISELCTWLKENQPEVVNSDELQEMFGGRKSFDWAIEDRFGTTGPYPGFQNYNTVGEQS